MNSWRNVNGISSWLNSVGVGYHCHVTCLMPKVDMGGRHDRTFLVTRSKACERFVWVCSPFLIIGMLWNFKTKSYTTGNIIKSSISNLIVCLTNDAGIWIDMVRLVFSVVEKYCTVLSSTPLIFSLLRERPWSPDCCIHDGFWDDSS